MGLQKMHGRSFVSERNDLSRYNAFYDIQKEVHLNHDVQAVGFEDAKTRDERRPFEIFRKEYVMTETNKEYNSFEAPDDDDSDYELPEVFLSIADHSKILMERTAGEGWCCGGDEPEEEDWGRPGFKRTGSIREGY